MLSNRIKTTSLVTSVAIVSVMLGALFGGHLFTLLTGEFPGPGPGFTQGVSIKIDTTTTINTQSPERFVSGPLRFIPQLVTWYWSTTGQMTQEADGSYSILWSHHAGVLTTLGKNYIEGKIGDAAYASNTKFANKTSLSSFAGAPAATWLSVYNEIVDGNGLARTEGAYASTGDGVWTITKQFTASGAYTDVQLTGLNWSTANSTLLCADTFTPVTLASGDKLTITWTITVT